MLCGGEPFICDHFFDVAERLGAAGVKLKVETNGQRFDASSARRLAALPMRSLQVSLDGDTQEVYARQRISGDSAGFTSSPWAYNGRIFAISEDGDTYVMQAGPEFKLLGKNSLGEMTLATPAVSRGSLFVRTVSRLYRITKPS
jgi:hypothetical protein